MVDIETDFTLNAGFVASLNDVADGKLDFSTSDLNKLKMNSNIGISFPIAVKASRIDYDRSRFKKLIQVTDTNNIF
ncbi:hypothetical protein D3C87_2111270 [compost metagenome]